VNWRPDPFEIPAVLVYPFSCRLLAAEFASLAYFPILTEPFYLANLLAHLEACNFLGVIELESDFISHCSFVTPHDLAVKVVFTVKHGESYLDRLVFLQIIAGDKAQATRTYVGDAFVFRLVAMAKVQGNFNRNPGYMASMSTNDRIMLLHFCSTPSSKCWWEKYTRVGRILNRV